jgi:hypothetical protein
MKSQIARIANSKPGKQIKNHPGVQDKNAKGVVVCQQCHNAHYKKAWHHPISKTVKSLQPKEEVSFTICPACSMINNHNYAGEIVMANVPPKIEVEMVNLIIGFNHRSQKNNPQHRVITIDKDKDAYRVLTTEDQMAVGLAKKIKSSFKAVQMTTSFSKEPYAMVLVRLVFDSSPQRDKKIKK